MANQLANDGATAVPADIAAQLATDDTCHVEVRDKAGNPSIMNLKHNWHWVWRDGQITNRIRCGACNQERENGK